MDMDMLRIRCTSSLEKIFNDEELQARECSGSSVLRGEMHSFQVAIRTDNISWVKVEFDSPIPGTTVREVGLSPSVNPGNCQDDNFLRATPGLYPDVLLPLDNARMAVQHLRWRSLWVSVPIPADFAPGIYTIKFTITPIDQLNNVLEEHKQLSATYTVEVMAATLPEQKLMRSEWFHTDCIYKYYNVPCWSEEHWLLLEKYFRNAADHGINMLLTPLWTPPLDTYIGGERPTVQLLDIEKRGDKYIFDFGRLERWFELGRKCGFKYFDFAHAFTQWGAMFTPKIVIRENGEEKKLFGWHVAANSPEYADFLQQLIPQLLEVTDKLGLTKNILFHVSDEPNEKHIENYTYGANLLRSLIGDVPIIDALSNVDFYDSGVVGIPVPSIERVEPFMERDVPILFTYYCVAEWYKVPNRFFSMPSARNRILGVLLYVYDLDGFLQWGYNFWYTQCSLKQDINVFQITDAGGHFPSGDAFAVYPGPTGPFDSIRHEVFTEGLQDLRALRLLEEKIGREATLEFIHDGLYYKMSMTHYPQEAAWLLNLRRRVNAAVAAN